MGICTQRKRSSMITKMALGQFGQFANELKFAVFVSVSACAASRVLMRQQRHITNCGSDVLLMMQVAFHCLDQQDPLPRYREDSQCRWVAAAEEAGAGAGTG